jgi:hypothetical protein
MFPWLTALLLLSAEPAPKAQCTASDSTPATVLEIATRPQHFVGRCVTVTGPASGIALYDGVEGIYLSQSAGRNSGRHRIGLYSRDNAIRREAAKRRAPALLTVTGRVDTCEAMEAAARRASEARKRETGEISIVFMSGYCHYLGGPVVRADSYTEADVRLERLTGERARRLYGELVVPPPDWPVLSWMLDLAGQFESALRTGDRERLARLHDISLETDHESSREMLDYLLDQASPFAEVRTGGQVQSELFIHSGGLSGSRYVVHSRYPSGVLCFCRTRDCTHVWPISASDASNAPDKPYACTMIEPQDWTRRKAAFRTPVNSAWLAEPARTAFRRD